MHVMQYFIQFGNGGYEMKKIFIILCCFGILSAHATEMCARNDTVVIPLDATIVSKSGGGDYVEGLWWLNFDYGTIYGASSCLSKKELMMYSDWNGTGNSPTVLNTADDELIGTSGYYMNADTNPDIPDAEKADYERGYCFSKLTHPMSSNWVYKNKWDYNVCTAHCETDTVGWLANSQTNFRNPLFNSIGTTPPWPLE